MSTGLCLLGDIHAGWSRLAALDAQLPPDVPILQVGDFGWYPNERPWLNQACKELTRPVYWIRGNHEHYPSMPWLDATEPVEVARNCYFVPDGTVLELAGLRIGCLGGAASIDYRYRQLGKDWFTEENITQAQLQRTEAWRDLDLVVTHCPPQATINANFNNAAKLMFGVGLDWRDPNAALVEQLWRSLGEPPLVCGHMHRSVVDGNVRILDINEAVLWQPESAGKTSP